MATVNSGTLIIALPELERALGHHAARAGLGDPGVHDRRDRAGADGRPALGMFGRKRAYVVGFAVFTFASLGAGFADPARS